MSCPTQAFFKNHAEGTQKRIHINLGVVAPNDYQLAGIIETAARQINSTYDWDTLELPIIEKEMGRVEYEIMLLDMEEVRGDFKARMGFSIEQYWKS